MKNRPHILVRDDGSVAIVGLVGWTCPAYPMIEIQSKAAEVSVFACVFMERPRWWQVRRWWDCLKMLGVIP